MRSPSQGRTRRNFVLGALCATSTSLLPRCGHNVLLPPSGDILLPLQSGKGFPRTPQQTLQLRMLTASSVSAAECDDECRARIAERRALFEQSRTSGDRQRYLDLSRQRAAMYNTTFRGATCIKGVPCW